MALARQIALLAAICAAILALAGCGGDDSTSADLDPAVGEAINGKLDQINERVQEGRCEGDNSAESSLASLREDLDTLLAGEDEQFVSDLTEMLDQLGAQIQEQCEQKEETTTSTSTTTTETDTDLTTTDTDTDETKDTTSSTTTKDTTEEEPPDNPDDGPSTPTPPGGGGTPGNGPPGGTPPGQSGGFSPGRSEAPKKPKKHKHHKPPKAPKDEKR